MVKGLGLYYDIGKKAIDLLYKDYQSDQKFTLTSVTTSGIVITSTGTKKGELLLANIGTKIINKNVSTDFKVDTNSNVVFLHSQRCVITHVSSFIISRNHNFSLFPCTNKHCQQYLAAAACRRKPLEYDKREKLRYVVRGKLGFHVLSGDSVRFNVNGQCDVDKDLKQVHACGFQVYSFVAITFQKMRWHQRIYRASANPRRRPECPSFPINEVLIQTADDLLENEDQGTSDSEKKVSSREYYCYQLQIRPTNSSILLRSGRILQQYTVDMYIKIETTRLDCIRNNQNLICADLYQGVIDSHAIGQRYGANIGRCFKLPASFIGCDRDFRRRYLCSMTVVQRYRKPDIFMTMTCNPRWPEIERELSPFEEPQNRPDLVSRVFRVKLFELKKDISVQKIFGNVAGYVYVVEFQKRCLPHAHYLIILDSNSKIRTADQYDEFVCAELPNAEENHHLYFCVVRHMMHGPCGRENPTNPCMKDGWCKNNYPRAFADTTTNGRDSYPIYRRRDTGVHVNVRGSQLDNRWVVPYNPFLSAKYDCRLNVEICSTIKVVKYMYKYVYKGHDRVSFALTDSSSQSSFDEITAYQSARWISPPEAAWRIYGFHLNEIHPNVVPLQLHLPNMQTVSFRPWENLGSVLDDDARKRTMLTAFFEQNVSDVFAQTRGLLEADNSIEQCLEEASRYQMSGALRRLFSTLLIYCNPNNPRLLWYKFYNGLSEDYAYAFPSHRRKVLQMTLRNICSIVESMGKNFSSFDFGDLKLDEEDFRRSGMKEIEEELNIPISSEEVRAVDMLNTE
ncbi:hypothetical protein KSS87_022808 [Heliosperma pusillum]|nr:hypothetical protein KSS87_022808 [Heliosperma pusillum]